VYGNLIAPSLNSILLDINDGCGGGGSQEGLSGTIGIFSVIYI